MKYDQIVKTKEKYNKTINEKEKEIEELKKRISTLEKSNNELRKKLYDAGEGKGEVSRLKKIIHTHKRENETLNNIIKNLDGSKLISSFSPERQALIKKIKKLEFENNSIFNKLAIKFKDGLDNVIEIAYRIKANQINDMDYYTFVFRDDIVGLLEKMLRTILKKQEDSASKFLVKMFEGTYKLPNKYYIKNPKLKDKVVINNILYLINLESTGYHGSKSKYKKVNYNQNTNELDKPDKFLNLDNESQLIAIFTLLEFMYDVFTNEDYEQNLLLISASWFKTI